MAGTDWDAGPDPSDRRTVQAVERLHLYAVVRERVIEGETHHVLKLRTAERRPSAIDGGDGALFGRPGAVARGQWRRGFSRWRRPAMRFRCRRDAILSRAVRGQVRLTRGIGDPVIGRGRNGRHNFAVFDDA